MYQAGQPQKIKRRRWLRWVVIVIIILLLLLLGLWIRNYFKPDTSIHQSAAKTTKISFTSKTKHYDEGDFGIDLPATWQPLSRPPHTYNSFTWQSPDRVSDGQQIEIYEDTIPVKFASNRALIVSGEGDHLSLESGVSDNCSQYTVQTHTTPNTVGVLAKWNNVFFLCDQGNTQRDVVGTSSTDGINTVILQSQRNGKKHKFFFTYTDYSQSADYTVFTDAITSLKMN